MGLKASVMTGRLLRELQIASKIIDPRSSLPILGNVLIETTEGGLALSATNLDQRLRVFVPAIVKDQGSTTVSVKTLLHLLGQFDKDGKTDLAMTIGHLDVDDGEGTVGHLPTIGVDEFPSPIDNSKWSLAAVIDSETLRGRLAGVLPFCATDEARPILTGVYVETAPGKMTFAAADNYSVAELSATVGRKSPKTSTILPSVAARGLVDLLARGVADVHYRVGLLLASFEFAQYTLVTRLIDGKYPNYGQVLPTYSSDSYAVTLDRATLLRALGLSQRRDYSVHLEVGPDSLTVKVPDADSSALFAKTIKAEVSPPRSEVIGVSPTLLTKVLRAIIAPTVTLYRNDPSVTAAIGIDIGTSGYRYCVMPVRLVPSERAEPKVTEAQQEAEPDQWTGCEYVWHAFHMSGPLWKMNAKQARDRVRQITLWKPPAEREERLLRFKPATGIPEGVRVSDRYESRECEPDPEILALHAVQCPDCHWTPGHPNIFEDGRE